MLGLNVQSIVFFIYHYNNGGSHDEKAACGHDLWREIRGA